MSSPKKSFFTILIALTIIFIFYFPSVFYSLKGYDEVTTISESYLPIPRSFTEMFELINILGLQNHFEALNTLYSNIISLRCNPFGNFLQLFIQTIFQKNTIYYHSYSLILHLLNALMLFFSLNKISYFLRGKENSITSSILTLLWALHPVNIESVLLLSNANIVLSYTFCIFSFLLYVLSYSKEEARFKISKKRYFFMFIFYFLALLIAEFHFTLPLIIYFYTVSILIRTGNKSFKEGFFMSIKTSFIFFACALTYIILFLISKTSHNFSHQSSVDLISERVLWLSPQIGFHLIKLIFYPKDLSIDQSFLIKLGENLFSFYTIFCFLFFLVLKLISLKSFLNTKKTFPILFILFIPFLTSLIPFLQIIVPSYNLASERYLYFPTFILIFGFAHFIFQLKLKHSTIIFILILITSIYSTRAYIRMLDWKDNFSLNMSAIQSTNNPLFKAVRYRSLVPQDKLLVENSTHEIDLKYKLLAYKNLKEAIKIYDRHKNKHSLKILKSYGIDSKTFYTKSVFYLANTDFLINHNVESALKIFKSHDVDLNDLDSSGLTFYSSLLFFNNEQDKAEKVLKFAYKKFPHSIKIIYPLCDLIGLKYNDLNEIERLTLNAFNLYPYNTNTLLSLQKLYFLKKDIKNYAQSSYICGLRLHSEYHLQNALEAYKLLNDDKNIRKVSRFLK